MNKQRVFKSAIKCTLLLLIGLFAYEIYHYDNRIFLNPFESRYKLYPILKRITINFKIDAFKKIHPLMESSVALSLDRRSKRMMIGQNLSYKDFYIPEPRFILKNSQDLFRKNILNVNFIGERDSDKLKGMIHVVKNGTYDKNHNCGFRGNVLDLLTPRSVKPKSWFHKAAPLLVPEGNTFQHFLDGVLPKLVQGRSILEDPEIKLVFGRKHRDSILTEFLNKLNYTKDRIVFAPEYPFGGDYLYYLCNTPPLHPELWQEGRRLLGAPEVLNVPWEHAHVVFVTREGCMNCGRVIQNQNQLISLLNSKYGNSVVRVFKGKNSLTETIDMFGKSRIVIGSHGGGMYNIMFAPANTTVIEIMPTRRDGYVAKNLADKIIWAQAVMLGQSYWRLSSNPVNIKDDMVVDLQEIEAILNIL